MSNGKFNPTSTFTLAERAVRERDSTAAELVRETERERAEARAAAAEATVRALRELCGEAAREMFAESWTHADLHGRLRAAALEAWKATSVGEAGDA